MAARAVAGGREAALRAIGVVHGRTLLGAIDAHLGNLHHVRPWLVAEREEVLHGLADDWLAAGGANWLPDLDAGWRARRLAALPPGRRAAEREAVDDLLTWAVEQGLIAADAPPPAAA